MAIRDGFDSEREVEGTALLPDFDGMIYGGKFING